ncbi:MAG TPA: YceI family protein [Bacteroidota bacterium]|nr:YceI family protein [Bacteroidota bacterium]
MNNLATATLAVGLGMAAPVMAQTTWTADKAHSSVNFTVTHMVISEVNGLFKDFDATLTATKPDFSDAVITASIKTASINTDNDQRDTHLRSDDFLNAEKYPAMTFKSTKIEKTGDGTYAITGNLTIRDVTKPVVLDTKFTGQVVTPWGVTAAGFKATTTIDRTDFGAKWNKALEAGGLMVSKDVRITLLFEFDQQKNVGQN